MSDFFGLICGQTGVFVSRGTLLPLCQRCLGLYSAAGLTALSLLLPKLRRGTLPTPPASILHVLILLIAGMGGLHIVDMGPRWRFLCGSWSGHVFALWLWAGGSQLLRRDLTPPAPWDVSMQIRGIGLVALVSLLALGIEHLLVIGPTFWTILATLGTVSMTAFAVRALVALAIRVVWRRREISDLHCG